MVDIKKIIQLGLNFFPEKKEKINKALNMAEQIVGNEPINDVGRAVDILKQNGVQPEFLNKLEKIAESPVAKSLFSLTGINKKSVLHDLNMLKNGYGAAMNNRPYTSNRELPVKDDLAVFKSGLKHFKK